MVGDSPAPEEAIRECPFCGGEAHLSGLGYCGPADCYDVKVICDECDAQGATLLVDQSLPNVAEQEAQVAEAAIAAWNRRAGAEREQQLEAQVREQEETILALQAEIRGIHDSQWNEIETAPHGVDVLLFSPADTWGNTTIEVGQASWGWRNSVANNMSYHSYATHWLPLPAAPRAALAGQTEGERNG